jgi:hypothetical protein
MTLEIILHEQLAYGRDFKHAWGIFLDTFYREVNQESKLALIRDEPIIPSLDRRGLAFIAASVHRLSSIHGLEIPSWVFHEQYYLDRPYFVGDPPDLLQLVYLIESPAEYKSRNIFTSENTLSRA